MSSAKLLPQITGAQALPDISENRRLQPCELAWTLSLDVNLALGFNCGLSWPTSRTLEFGMLGESAATERTPHEEDDWVICRKFLRL